MNPKYKCLYPLLGFTLLLSGCQPTPSSSSDPASSEPSSETSSETSSESSTTTPSENPIDTENPNYYKNITARTKFNQTNPLNFSNSLKDGLNDDVWYALDGAWHNEDSGAPHNGVRRRNLFYTRDSNNNDYLAIKGRGYYNQEDPSKVNMPEGGVIVSKNHLTPGRYEIEMSALPREGAVTAMWTYCTTTGSEASSQNEIDIEIGGLTGANHFEHMWSTTWTKKTNKETKTPKVSDQLYLNDGKIHKYTFDWYTDYAGSGVKRVDWFIDEVYLTSITGEVVPEHGMPLWVGVWFPPRWAGNPAFISDYLLIKHISFTAFESRQWVETCRTNPGYDKVSIADAGIQTIPFSTIKGVNKLSNADFETMTLFTRDNSYYGWSVDTASKGSMSLSNEKTSGQRSFALTASNDTSSKYHGQYIKQTLTNAFPGYEYEFAIDAKLSSVDSVGNIEILYRSNIDQVVGQKIIPVTSTSWQSFAETLIVPAGASKIEITLTAETKTVNYDNAKLIFLKSA